jgi:hypothetical protein
MGGRWSYVRRLDRYHSRKGERCGRQKSLHVDLAIPGLYPLPGVVEAVAQHLS